jgi:hypothetical protein
MFGFGNTFTVEFIGGSRDGDVIQAKGAPDFLKFNSGNRWIEVYERQNEAPPIIYVQIGYAEEEQWK